MTPEVAGAGPHTRPPVLAAHQLTRHYGHGSTAVAALRGVDLHLDAGQVLVIQGRSGSGKTTLLNLLGGLDLPTAGMVAIRGQVLTEMSEAARAELRRSTIGFVFQSFGLLPMLSAAENVEVPMRLLRTEPARRRERARELLDLVGLGHRTAHRPGELSGGEQQRVAVARALANGPRLLLADEPTGQLDSSTGREVVEMLTSLVRAEGVAAVIATHDPAIITVADRVIRLHDGRFVDHAVGRPDGVGDRRG
ncbi:MAG: ABC transporter ATP-binding protein [Acidimicrobiia bacterium]|nr:ABC transporter ATP-binding protein [Acidimicrobiia bacterium]